MANADTDTAARIAELRAAKAELMRQLGVIVDQLNAFKVKCPTCRCRIMPGEDCACCGEHPLDALEDKF